MTPKERVELASRIAAAMPINGAKLLDDALLDARRDALEEASQMVDRRTATLESAHRFMEASESEYLAGQIRALIQKGEQG